MATGKILSFSNCLIERGTFTGDINDTDIPPGIYVINAATSYTHTDLDTGEITVPSYCVFIQFPYVYAQLFLSSPIIFRKCTGSPVRWRTSQYNADKSYIQPS